MTLREYFACEKHWSDYEYQAGRMTEDLYWETVQRILENLFAAEEGQG